MNVEDINVKKELNIIYMGTPQFSKIVLQGLIKKHKIRAIITQPDKPVGRKKEIKFSPVKQFAYDNSILVLQPENIYNDCNEIIDLEPDLIITCAYGQKLPIELLQLPKLGCINVHASLLPKLRGGAPIQKAIIDGYSKTGVTIMYMAEEMDTGDIISQQGIPISDDDTAETLYYKLADLGTKLLLDTLPSIINKTNTRQKQKEEDATYALTIKRETEKISFDQTKRQIVNLVRGLNDWPGAYCILDNHIMKVWSCYETDNVYPEKINGEITSITKDGFGIKVSNGEIVCTIIQLEGKNKISGKDFVNGHKNIVGKILK